MRFFYLLLVLVAAPALADTLVASRPGLMCTSPDALAKLTLRDGSSRAASPGAHPGDKTLKEEGGCIDFAAGANVLLQAARKNTSIVSYDALDGKGRRAFVVPNIDFNAPVAAVTAGVCLNYDVPVTLTGKITMGSAYGEDNTGKLGWSHWRQITLDKPVCTRANPKEYEDAETDVRSLQPVFLDGSNPTLVAGERLTIVGKLFHQENSNQRTAVLVQVVSMKVKP